MVTNFRVADDLRFIDLAQVTPLGGAKSYGHNAYDRSTKFSAAGWSRCHFASAGHRGAKPFT